MKLPRTTTGKYSVEAVAKALDILQAFGDSEELTLNEVSGRVRLNKSRTFRLLYTLSEYGYVDRCTGGSRYKLGAQLLERASHVHKDIKQLARPFMLTLRGRFNENVNLSVFNEGSVLYIDILETSRPFRMTAIIGCRMPAHLTSMGKAMLACLPADDRNSPQYALVNRLRRGQKQVLMRELELVRRQGYAIDNEQNERGVACIGAAILDAAGFPTAAMSVSGPAYRILPHKRKIAQEVVAACRSISNSLGFAATEEMATNSGNACRGGRQAATPERLPAKS